LCSKSNNKISLEIEKILNFNTIQKCLFNDISKKDMYLALNKLIAYNSYAKEEQSI